MRHKGLSFYDKKNPSHRELLDALCCLCYSKNAQDPFRKKDGSPPSRWPVRQVLDEYCMLPKDIESSLLRINYDPDTYGLNHIGLQLTKIGGQIWDSKALRDKYVLLALQNIQLAALDDEGWTPLCFRRFYDQYVLLCNPPPAMMYLATFFYGIVGDKPPYVVLADDFVES